MKSWSKWSGAAAVLATCALGCSGSDADNNTRPGTVGDGQNFGNTNNAGGTAGASGIPGGSAGVGGNAGGAAGTAGAMLGGTNCGEVVISPEVEYSPGNLMVIFDRSISMNTAFANGQTRLEAADQAIKDALTPFACGDPTSVDGDQCSDALTVASILFPSAPGGLGACYVEDITSAQQIPWQGVTSFLTTWGTYWQANQLVLGTPITTAFERTEQALSTSTLTGTTAILFVTDGEGTCGTGTDPIMQAQAWLGQNMSTYVVSLAGDGAGGGWGAFLPGGGGGTFNDSVAMAGGSMASINPTDSVELTSVIGDILQKTASVASCDVTLNGGKLTDTDAACTRGDVTVGTTKAACDPTDGFSVIAADAIRLNGPACDKLMASGQLSAVFPCDVIVPD